MTDQTQQAMEREALADCVEALKAADSETRDLYYNHPAKLLIINALDKARAALAPAAPAVGAPVAIYKGASIDAQEELMAALEGFDYGTKLYLAPPAASLREQEWDYEPQLTAIEHGSEPSLRRIIKHYYRSNGIASAKADKLTAQYIDAQRLGREKDKP
jgi:hypothetical protein